MSGVPRREWESVRGYSLEAGCYKDEPYVNVSNYRDDSSGATPLTPREATRLAYHLLEAVEHALSDSARFLDTLAMAASDHRQEAS